MRQARRLGFLAFLTPVASDIGRTVDSDVRLGA